MHIIGTAGHVDHGKSTLVRVLTGTDPDRLPEEKRRALTIELGFASYQNAEGQTIGVVDVPGHERFIRNMVGGTWSLDCAMLVIAADDGWMQQTEDHAQVLKGMQIPKVFVVVSKSDLIDPVRLTIVSADIDRRFSSLFGFPPEKVVVSALHDQDLTELKSCIDRHLAASTRNDVPAKLFVDRAFVMPGTGVVVTGSLRGGSLSVGDEVTVLPKRTKGRIRSLQSFGKPVETVGDGTRTAIGLQGISTGDIERGDCITSEPEMFSTVTQVFALLYPPYDHADLAIRNHGQVEISSGTWHDKCMIHLVRQTTGQDVKPMLVRLCTQHQQAWFWRQPIILMQPGSSTVLAYGIILYTKNLGKDELQKLVQTIRTFGNLPQEIRTQEHLRLLISGYHAMQGEQGSSLILCDQEFLRTGHWWVSKQILERVQAHLVEIASRPQPLSLKIAKQVESFPSPLVGEIIDLLRKKGTLQIRNGKLEMASRENTILDEQAQSFLLRIHAYGFNGYPVKQLDKRDKATVGTLLQAGLILILDSTFIYTKETYLSMVALVLKDRNPGDVFTIGEAKTHLPLSRKLMIPLLNQMETDTYVKRSGDSRIMLRPLDP